MLIRPTKPRRFHATATTILLAASLLPGPGCTSDDVPIAQVPADATEKVEKGQTPPVAGAHRLPPTREQSKGRPY